MDIGSRLFADEARAKISVELGRFLPIAPYGQMENLERLSQEPFLLPRTT